MDKETQKLIEHDKFAEGVTHSVEFVKSHRSQVSTYIAIGAAAAALIGGGWWYRSSQQATRQSALAEALRNKDGVVGAAQPGSTLPAFATQADKDKAILEGYRSVIAKHGGSDEAAVAHYELGVLATDTGKLDEAVTHYKAAIDSASADVASVAKHSLAQIYSAQGKTGDAEALLRSIINSPTLMVSREQATMTLARILIPSKPEDARKLIEPLQKDKRPAVARNADALFGELPAKK